VYLHGCGLASALGPDLPTALHALRSATRPRMRRYADLDWPVHALWPKEAAGAGWLAQARAWVCAAAAQSGALDGRRAGPLFVASSSLDIGLRETGLDWDGDPHAFAEAVGGWLDWRGPVFSVCNACTSSAQALLAAHGLLAGGEHDEALVLGLELPNRYTVAGFGAMQLLSERAAQPMGAARNGLLPGEAVAALSLRATPARWRLAGGANVVAGGNPAGIEAGALAQAIRQALQRAGVAAADIGLVKLHAVGSPANDAVEARVLDQVAATGVHGRGRCAWVTFKPALGHTMGASGAAEIALLSGCLAARAWPSLDYAPDPLLAPRLAEVPHAHVRHALLLFAGIGGGHAAWVLSDEAPT